MEQRVTMVTLGVENLEASRQFYGRLGWEESDHSQPGIAFYDLGGLQLALYPADELAAEVGMTRAERRFKGVTLAYNVRQKPEVDAVMKEAVAAGADSLDEGTERDWGGYSGYFADPDGHVWEVAWNPHMVPEG